MHLKLQPQEKLQDWNGKLNPAQLEAVNHKNGPLLVIAGAGSGKTRVLTNRIANLIKEGIQPWNILSLTFTNKAAKEMKERISKIVSLQQAESVWAGTFHSIFARILRIEADKIGYTSNFSIYDTDDQLSAIRTVMGKLNFNQQQYSPQAIRSKISSLKNKMITAKEFSEEADRGFDKKAADVYKEYEIHLRSNNAMDFDDLLLNVIKLFTISNDILKTYQDKFKYILVDEYQDTNRAQYLILKELAKAHQNICVVGDDAQSIYRWRGADIRNILDFQKDYPYAKTVRLEQNYRSTKNILGAADSVIKYNKNQLEKTLWTDNPEGDPIEVYECENDKSEAEKIASLIKASISSGKTQGLNDHAILYRTNAQSLALENALRIQNLPYVVVGGLSFFKRKEIKDVLSYLRLLINPQDGESLMRIINEPPRGLGKTSLEHIAKFADSNRISIYEAFQKADQNPNLQKRAITSAKKFIYMVDQYREKYSDENEFYILKDYIDETGILEMYEEIGTDDAMDRLNNIKQLLSDINLYLEQYKENDLDDYLQQTALATDFDEKDTSQEKITLMTLHTAKGLEYPHVYIAGMEQGLFPLSRSEYDRDEEEEERRLFYVGITRAKEKLFLSYARRRMRFGEISYQQVSNFVSEIDNKYLFYPEKPSRPAIKKTYSTPSFLDQGPKSGALKDRFSGEKKEDYSQLPSHDEDYSQIPDSSEDLKIGDIVAHSQFGEGKITGLKGEGNRRQAVVRFASVGRKMLMLKYAKLRLVNRGS